MRRSRVISAYADACCSVNVVGVLKECFAAHAPRKGFSESAHSLRAQRTEPAAREITLLTQRCTGGFGGRTQWHRLPACRARVVLWFSPSVVGQYRRSVHDGGGLRRHTPSSKPGDKALQHRLVVVYHAQQPPEPVCCPSSVLSRLHDTPHMLIPDKAALDAQCTADWRAARATALTWTTACGR